MNISSVINCARYRNGSGTIPCNGSSIVLIVHRHRHRQWAMFWKCFRRRFSDDLWIWLFIEMSVCVFQRKSLGILCDLMFYELSPLTNDYLDIMYLWRSWMYCMTTCRARFTFRSRVVWRRLQCVYGVFWWLNAMRSFIDIDILVVQIYLFTIMEIIFAMTYLLTLVFIAWQTWKMR